MKLDLSSSEKKNLKRMNVPLAALTLAAGKSTRMKSETIKILHKACGKYILEYVIDLVEDLNISKHVIVVGYQREKVMETFRDRDLEFAIQEEQKGTGHAVMQAKSFFEDFNGNILLLSGDVPLLTKQTIEELLDIHISKNAAATVLTAKLDNPYNYGRILRDFSGNIAKIVEEKDANEYEKKIKEINSGIYIFNSKKLFQSIDKLNTNNAQGEFYLTDIISILRENGEVCSAYMTDDPNEILGINTREQLWFVTNIIKKRKIKKLMENGVTFINPENIHIDVEVEIDYDTIIYPNVVLEGKTRIGKNCIIKPFSHLIDENIEDNQIVGAR